MNVYITVDAIMAIVIIALGWFLYRQYKKVGRRCDGGKCGNAHVWRVCKIILAPGETVSYRSSKGELRGWIRAVVKLTFTVCDRVEKHDGKRRVKLVKIDYDPISIWHAYWAKWRHKEQYYLADQDLEEAAQRRMRELYLGGRYKDPDAGTSSDTPPLSLSALFEDYFEEVTDDLADMMIGEEKIK